MRRTLETAALAMPDATVPRVATPLLQEIGTSNADTGRPRDELTAEFGGSEGFDLSEVDEEWFVKPAPWCKQRRIPLDDGLCALAERQRAFVEWVQSRPEASMVVVTHHGFICHLLAVELANCEVAAMELTPEGEWVEQPGANPRRIPVVLADGLQKIHKGSRPLRASTPTILKQHGALALEASERAAARCAGGSSPARETVHNRIRATVAATMLVIAAWQLARSFGTAKG